MKSIIRSFIGAKGVMLCVMLLIGSDLLGYGGLDTERFRRIVEVDEARARRLSALKYGMIAALNMGIVVAVELGYVKKWLIEGLVWSDQVTLNDEGWVAVYVDGKDRVFVQKLLDLARANGNRVSVDWLIGLL